MEDFPANSARIRARSEGPPPDQTIRRGEAIEQVTSAEVRQRRRGLGRRVKETFVGGSGRMAFDYMIADVVVPAIQDTILEALQGGLERLIKGETRHRRGFTTASPYTNLTNPPRINYQSMGHTPTARTLSPQARTRHDFRDIVIASRQEADEVLERMYDILGKYGSVSVSDLYELTGIQSGHTDHKWGWVTLRGAKIARMRNQGYLLDLPIPEPLG